VAWTRKNGAYDPFVWSGSALQEVFIDLSALRSWTTLSGFRLEHFAAPGHHRYRRGTAGRERPVRQHTHLLERSDCGAPGFPGTKERPHGTIAPIARAR
jgi:hypothetical protein